MCEIRRTLVPVQLCHLCDHRRDDWIDPAVHTKEIAPVDGEDLQLARIGEVQATGDACQQHAERKDVRQFIVMPDRMLPRPVIRKEDRLGDAGARRADTEVRNRQRGLIDVRRAPRFGHNFHSMAHWRLESFHFGGVLLRRTDFCWSKHQMPLFRDNQVLNPVEWCDQTRLVRGQHLLHERQQRCQYVVRFEAVFRASDFEELQERRLTYFIHRSPPLWPAVPRLVP